MARVTAEDCLKHIGNHFKLVLVAGHRAKQILAGSEPYVERHDDKATVVALREIAGQFVSEDILQEPVEQKSLAAEEELKELLAEASAEPTLSDAEIFDEMGTTDELPVGSEALAASADADGDTDAAKEDATNIDLDTLESAEQSEQEELSSYTMQVDDHDTMVAETAEEIEQRADLALDPISTDTEATDEVVNEEAGDGNLTDDETETQ